MSSGSLGRMASLCVCSDCIARQKSASSLSLSQLLLLSMASQGVGYPFGPFGSAVLHPLPASWPLGVWKRQPWCLVALPRHLCYPYCPCYAYKAQHCKDGRKCMQYMSENKTQAWDLACWCGNHVMHSDTTVKWVNAENCAHSCSLVQTSRWDITVKLFLFLG